MANNGRKRHKWGGSSTTSSTTSSLMKNMVQRLAKRVLNTHGSAILLDKKKLPKSKPSPSQAVVPETPPRVQRQASYDDTWSSPTIPPSPALAKEDQDWLDSIEYEQDGNTTATLSPIRCTRSLFDDEELNDSVTAAATAEATEPEPEPTLAPTILTTTIFVSSPDRKKTQYNSNTNATTNKVILSTVQNCYDKSNNNNNANANANASLTKDHEHQGPVDLDDTPSVSSDDSVCNRVEDSAATSCADIATVGTAGAASLATTTTTSTKTTTGHHQDNGKHDIDDDDDDDHQGVEVIDLADAMDLNNVVVDEALDGSFAFEQHEVRLEKVVVKDMEEPPTEQDHPEEDVEELDITLPDDGSFAPSEHEHLVVLGRAPSSSSSPSVSTSMSTPKTSHVNNEAKVPSNTIAARPPLPPPRPPTQAQVLPRREPSQQLRSTGPVDLDDASQISVQSEISVQSDEDDDDASFHAIPPPHLHRARTTSSAPFSRVGHYSTQKNNHPARGPVDLDDTITSSLDGSGNVSNPPQEHQRQPQAHQTKPGNPKKNESAVFVRERIDLDDAIFSASNNNDNGNGSANSKTGQRTATMNKGLIVPLQPDDVTEIEDFVAQDDSRELSFFQLQRLEQELDAAIAGRKMYSEPVQDLELDDSLAWTKTPSFVASSTTTTTSTAAKASTSVVVPKLPPSYRDSPKHFGGSDGSSIGGSAASQQQKQQQQQDRSSTIVLQHVISRTESSDNDSTDSEEKHSHEESCVSSNSTQRSHHQQEVTPTVASEMYMGQATDTDENVCLHPNTKKSNQDKKDKEKTGAEDSNAINYRKAEEDGLQSKIKPKPLNQRTSRRPPPAFPGTKARLSAVWEEPRSRRNTRYTGPVDLDESVHSESQTEEIYTGPVDLDEFFEEVDASKGQDKNQEGPKEWPYFVSEEDEDSDGSNGGLFFAQLVSPPKNSPSSTMVVATGNDVRHFPENRFTANNEDDIRLMEGDWMDFVDSSPSTDGSERAKQKNTSIKLPLHPKDTASVSSQLARISTNKPPTNAWIDFAKSDDSETQTKIQGIPAVTPEKHEFIQGFLVEVTPPPKGAPSKTQPRQLKTLPQVTPPSSSKQSKSPARQVMITITNDGIQAEQALSGTESSPRDAVINRVNDNDTSGESSSPLMPRKHVWKDDHDNCHFVPSAMDPEDNDLLEDQEDIYLEALEGSGDNLRAPGCVSQTLKYDEPKNQQHQKIRYKQKRHSLSADELNDTPSQSNDPDDVFGVDKKEEYKLLENSDEGLCPHSDVPTDFEHYADGHEGDCTAQEIQHFKKICMQNAMKAKSTRPQEDDGTDDFDTLSAIADIQSAKSNFDMVLKQLEKCMHESGQFFVESTVPPACQQTREEGGPESQFDAGLEETFQTAIEEINLQGSKTFLPGYDIDLNYIQQQISQAMDIAAKAKENLDVEMLQREIEKLQATANLLRAARQNVTTARSLTPKKTRGNVQSTRPSTNAFNLSSYSGSDRNSISTDSSGNHADDERGYCRNDDSVSSFSTPEKARVLPIPEKENTKLEASTGHEAEFQTHSLDCQDDIVTPKRKNSKKEKNSVAKRVLKAFWRIRTSPSLKGDHDSIHELKPKCQESQKEQLLSQLKIKRRVVDQISRLRGLRSGREEFEQDDTPPRSPGTTITFSNKSETIVYDFRKKCSAPSQPEAQPKLMSKPAINESSSGTGACTSRSRPKTKDVPEGTFVADFANFEAHEESNEKDDALAFVADFSKCDSQNGGGEGNADSLSIISNESSSDDSENASVNQESIADTYCKAPLLSMDFEKEPIVTIDPPTSSPHTNPNRLVPDTADFTAEMEEISRKRFQLEEQMISFLLEGLYPVNAPSELPTPADSTQPVNIPSQPDSKQETPLNGRSTIATEGRISNPGYSAVDVSESTEHLEQFSANSPAFRKERLFPDDDESKGTRATDSPSLERNNVAVQGGSNHNSQRSSSPDIHFDQLVDSLVQRVVDSDPADPSFDLDKYATPNDDSLASFEHTAQQREVNSILVETVGYDEEFSVMDDNNSILDRTRATDTNLVYASDMSMSAQNQTNTSTRSLGRHPTGLPQSRKRPDAPKLTRRASDGSIPLMEGTFSAFRDIMTGIFKVQESEPELARSRTRELAGINHQTIWTSEAMSVECTLGQPSLQSSSIDNEGSSENRCHAYAGSNYTIQESVSGTKRKDVDESSANVSSAYKLNSSSVNATPASTISNSRSFNVSSGPAPANIHRSRSLNCPAVSASSYKHSKSLNVLSTPASTATGSPKSSLIRQPNKQSPAGVNELEALGSYFDATLSLESSTGSQDTDESSLGNGPRSLNSEEEAYFDDSRNLHQLDSAVLETPFSLVRSETPDRVGRLRKARNERSGNSMDLELSEDPVVFLSGASPQRHQGEEEEEGDTNPLGLALYPDRAYL